MEKKTSNYLVRIVLLPYYFTMICYDRQQHGRMGLILYSCHDQFIVVQGRSGIEKIGNRGIAPARTLVAPAAYMAAPEFKLDIHIPAIGIYPDITMLPLVGKLSDPVHVDVKLVNNGHGIVM